MIFRSCLALLMVTCSTTYLRAEPEKVDCHYSISPLTIEFSNNKTQQWIKVENAADVKGPVAIEFQVFEREQDPLTGAPIAGKDALDQDAKFSLNPSKLILFPGETQMVDLRLLADNSKEREQVYTLLAKQIPLPNLDNKEKVQDSESAVLDIKTLLNYQGVIYVTPAGVKPKIDVVKVARQMSEENRPQMAVELVNNGTGKQLFTKSFTLKCKMANGQVKTVTIDSKNVKNSKHGIYPGSHRVIAIDWPSELPEVPVETQIEWQS